MCGDASTDRVIFTGALIGTDTTESSDIREQLQVWVKSEPTIVVQGVHLKIAACIVRLEENEKPQCLPLYIPIPSTEGVSRDEESDSFGFPLYIGIAGGGLLLLICIIATIIVAVVVMKRRQKKQMYRTNNIMAR